MSTENGQRVPVKIASWRVPADSPFLKFTLVVMRGEFGGAYLTPRASVTLRFQLVHTNICVHTHTHMHAQLLLSVTVAGCLLTN